MLQRQYHVYCMKRQLTLEVDEAVLEMLGIDEKTPLDVSASGDALVVTPIRDADADAEEKFKNAADKVNRRYKQVLRRLSK
jgi:hypothetical protein